MNPEDIADNNTEDNKSLVWHHTEEDAKTARQVRMAQVISKFAGTLTLRPIQVDVVTADMARTKYETQAPAWSDSEHIWFNQDDLGDLTDPHSIVGIKGLSLHEISHILLTPRTGSNLSKEVQRLGLWRAFNALEDQRIEMMMTKRFGNVADWLIAATMQFIIAEPEQHSLVFPLLHGRKFLPIELRTAVRDLYENQADIAELESLIDEYIVLNLNNPDNYDNALRIIMRFHWLINQGLGKHFYPDGESDTSGPDGTPYVVVKSGWQRVKDPNGHESRKDGEHKSSKNKPMGKGEQGKLADKVAAEVSKQGTYPPPEPSDIPGDSDANDGQGAGKGSPKLDEMANKALNDIIQRKQKDIANTIKQFNGEADLKSKAKKPIERGWFRNEQPSVEAVSNVRSFARELEQLKADYDPGWVRRVESGRLNVQRYVSGEELDECFDQWDDGREDAVDIEAVILLDTSGSMSNVMKEAYEAMWTTKRSLDKVNANTTVISFSSYTNLVYSNTERAGTQMKYSGASGGTEPLDALEYARNILAESERAIKVFIVLTDGEWGWGHEDDQHDKIILELRRGGVITALGYIQNGGHSTNIKTHGCEVAANISDVSQVFVLARNIVKAGVKRNLAVT
jgi:Mg-chelatase subunit ChlD